MKKTNPINTRDLSKLLLFPTLSWSSLNAFESYDQDKWYNQYVLGIKSEHKNNAMIFGTEIGERLIDDPTFLHLVPRPSVFEQELEGKLGDIRLIGHLDGLTIEKKELLEYKTSANPNKWHHQSVADHGQIDFYCLLLWLNYKIRPEELTIRLVYIPVEEDGSFKMKLSDKPVAIIPTHRTMKDILTFAHRIKVVHKEMIAFVVEKRKMEELIVN